jgi:hypothetical protein
LAEIAVDPCIPEDSSLKYSLEKIVLTSSKNSNQWRVATAILVHNKQDGNLEGIGREA